MIYQVYPRSYADADGDGVGDLPGITSRIPYLRDLGVDAIWVSPFYTSPQADGGYDVADYRDIEPRYGTLADAERLVAEAHELGLRVLADLVPDHTSVEHAWFRAAVAAEPGDPLGSATTSVPAEVPTATSPRPTRLSASAAPPGPGCSGRTARRRTGTSTFSTPASPTSLVEPRCPDRVPGRAAVLVGPGDRRLPGRRGPRSGQGRQLPRRRRNAGGDPRRGEGAGGQPPVLGSRTNCTRSSGSGARSWTSTPAIG